MTDPLGVPGERDASPRGCQPDYGTRPRVAFRTVRFWSCFLPSIPLSAILLFLVLSGIGSGEGMGPTVATIYPYAMLAFPAGGPVVAIAVAAVQFVSYGFVLGIGAGTGRARLTFVCLAIIHFICAGIANAVVAQL